MKRWLVVTPEFGEVVPILDYGQGPMEYQCDVIEVEAETRRDAVLVGVALMRSQPRQFHYFRDHLDGNPYAGVKAELMPDPCPACQGLGFIDHADCAACEGSGAAS